MELFFLSLSLAGSPGDGVVVQWLQTGGVWLRAPLLTGMASLVFLLQPASSPIIITIFVSYFFYIRTYVYPLLLPRLV